MLEEPDFSNSIAAKTINKNPKPMIIIPMAILKSTKPLSFLSVYVLPKTCYTSCKSIINPAFKL
jgi:hypothetical protein